MDNEIILDKFSNRLFSLIKERDIDINLLTNKLGLKSKSTIYRYMNGQMAPKITTIKCLADFLNVNPVWLMGYDVPMERTSEPAEFEKIDEFGNPVVPVPILGTVKAGYNFLAQENWIGTVDVDKKLTLGSELFALIVKGDSMFPFFWEDDIVIIRKQSDFETGDFVVALIGGEEATIKKGKKSTNGILLQPLNTAYEPLIFTYKEVEEIPVQIIGIVKQLKREL